MKRNTVIAVSLMIALLLAGLCACKQEVSPEKPVDSVPILNAGIAGVVIPGWEKSTDGLQNLPVINTYGTDTGVSEALVEGLNNPPVFSKAKNLIVIVCEGMTSELIESSTTQYGELILNSLPVKGTTLSKFTDSDGTKNIASLAYKDLWQTVNGIVAWGDLATNSMRRMVTYDGNDVGVKDVYMDEFNRSEGFVCALGLGDFDECYTLDSTNLIYKNATRPVETLNDAVSLFKNKTHFEMDEEHQKDVYVQRLYSVFKSDETLPSFRQETQFALAWLQWIGRDVKKDGFSLFMSYSPSEALDSFGVQDFDEGVAVAVQYVLENPDTALLICGCPVDGSEAQVCFYGLGKSVSAQSTFFECVNSLV